MTGDTEQLAALCRRLGAAPPQDRLMARKLLERADQMARTHGMDKLQALQYLLSLMTKARGNDVMAHPAQQKGSERKDNSKKTPNGQENH